MQIKKIFSSLVLPFLLLSCINSSNENCRIVYYSDSEQIKEKQIFSNIGDSASYSFESYYLNGKLKSKGQVYNYSKQGLWTEWYADGDFRREIYYDEGQLNLFDETRLVPQISCDSLPIGVETLIRVINLYPQEGIGCSNGIIKSSKDKDMFDFVVIPNNSSDSIKFFYSCPWISKDDTISLSTSKISDPSEYGLTKEDLQKSSTIEVVKRKNKIITLKTVPLYISLHKQ